MHRYLNLAPREGQWSTISRSVIRSPIRALRHEIAMTGILVHGDNHFIVRGPLPDREVALALIRHWSLIQIGVTTPLPARSMANRLPSFRENLEWAVVVPGDDEMSPAVTRLLDELSARGVTIHDSSAGPW